MREEVLTVIRVPIQSIAEELRSRHKLQDELFDVRLEADAVVLSFKRNSAAAEDPSAAESRRPVRKEGKAGASRSARSTVAESAQVSEAPLSASDKPTRRRRKAKRNRMKTKGWPVVGKITNSKGQTAVIYKPFVDALFGKALSPAEQRAQVSKILRSNGNDPEDASIEYYLMNTTEYLAQANTQSSAKQA